MIDLHKIARTLDRFSVDRGGSTTLEFALTSVALFGMIVGIVEFGRVLETRNKFMFAVDHGTRQVLMNPAISGSLVEKTIRDTFDNTAAESLSVVLGIETIDGVDYHTFDITYPVSIYVPFVDDSVTLSILRRTPAI